MFCPAQQATKGPDQPQQLVIHTHWGGRINRPWALALDVAWRQHTGCKPELHADNNVVVIQCKSLNEGLAPDFAEQLLGWVNGDNLLTLLRERLEASGFWCAIPRMRWSCIAAQQAAL